MLYQDATVVDGKIVITNTIERDQSSLTSDCWIIQFKGLEACNDCEFRNSDECGGGNTLKTMQEKEKINETI